MFTSHEVSLQFCYFQDDTTFEKQSALFALAIADIINQAGFPANVFQTLLVGADKVADLIAANASKEVYPTGWVLQPSPSLCSLLTLDAREANSVVGEASFSSSIYEGM